MGLRSCYVCKTKKDVSEFYNDSSKSSGVASKCKPCSNIKLKERRKRRIQNDPEYRKMINRKKEKKRVKREERDPVFKLKRKMRNVLRKSFKRRGYTKNSKSQKILGVDWGLVKEHFESLFTDGMSWDNHGLWEIDHIIPVSSAKNYDEIIKLNHYSNLQPLWKEDNRKKGNNVLWKK